MNKKGQAAMEFLMTYGWAILVVLAAIGALAYFGVLSPDRFLPSKCTVAAGFSCTEHKVNSGGTIQIRLQNNLGSDVANVNVTIAGKGAHASCTPGMQNFTNVANGDDVGGALLTFDCGGALTGSKFSGDGTIGYIASGQTVDHSVTGTIVSAIE